MTKEKLGLVLEGGGVKGAYQVGAMKALDELGVSYDGIAGTSIGAINGALYLDGGIEKMLTVWKEIKTNTIYELTDEEIEAIKGLNVTPAILKVLKEKRLKTIKMLADSYQKSQNFFENLVSEDDIRSSGKEYGLVTFDISEMQPFEKMMGDIEDGKLIDYIIASATFPIFPPKEKKKKKYIDGGVYDNMPINLLARNGYNKILVIRTNIESKPPKRKIEKEGLDLFYITPQADLGLAMAFSSSNVHAFMTSGYADAQYCLENGLKEFLFGNDKD